MVTIDNRIKDLIDINEKLLKELNEIYSNNKNEFTLKEISSVVNNVSKVTQSLSSIIFKIDEIKNREEIDFHHPKIQRAFMFFTQVFINSMQQAGIDDDTIESVMSQMAINTVGFEEKLSKTLNSVRGSAIERTINPLVHKALGHK